jgi:predicted secreted Zn-dependent protease
MRLNLRGEATMMDQATRCANLHRRLALVLLLGAAPVAAVAQTAPAQAPAPAAPVAPPQPTLAQMPGVTVQYYDVAGKTIPEMKASMEAQRPAGATGAPVPASSTWSIGISVRRSTLGNQCKIVGAKARLTANVVMPRLAVTEGVPEPELRQWQAYVAGLEQQQVALLSQPLARLGEVERAAMASTCQGAQAAASQAIAAITAQTPAPAAPALPPVG